MRRLLSVALLIALIMASTAVPAHSATLALGRANLSRGMRGTEIKTLQQSLTKLGFSTGVISGYFGPVTQRQVRAYQKKKGIRQTGIVGPVTKAALSSDITHLEQAAKSDKPAVQPTQVAPQPPPIRGSVQLTFDDGPDSDTTPAILSALAAVGAKATFFCNGQDAAAHEDLVKQIVDAGHAIGNHGWGTADYSKLSEAAIATDLRAANQAIVDAGAAQPTLFRPPGGLFDGAVNAAAARVGLRPAYWSNVGGRTDSAHALKAAFDGAVLMLPDNTETAAALPALLASLRADGWAVKAPDRAK